jgi:Mg2+ and Co2+ transporter CorA
LSYHLDILNRFGNRLRENIFDIERHQTNVWPTSYNDNDEAAARSKPKADAAAELLLTDFQNLLSRAEQLSARCQSGMSICMNSAAIAESQRAIAQAMSVEQLTRLAFFYVPLSFTSSFFGMNLLYFGTGNIKLWVWFEASFPLVLASYLVLAWLSGKWI